MTCGDVNNLGGQDSVVQSIVSLKKLSVKNSLALLVLHAKALILLNPIALRKAKIAYSFDLSECNKVK